MTSTRGDLIVMTPSKNAISTLIREYDRSNFTHVGLDAGDGSVVSCRTESDLIRKGEDGGVRQDYFATITDRHCYRVPVAEDQAVKDAAVDTALRWSECEGRGRISGFSFPKMFQCAVAVNASRPDADFSDTARALMLDAAFAAANAWAYDGNTASFFCAEMVVEAYRWKVPKSLLEPPATPPEDDVLRAHDHPDVDGFVAKVKQAWVEGLKAVTMAQVIASVALHDIDFFFGAGRALWEWQNKPAPTPDADQVRGASETEFLPAAVVTPRMLMGLDWVGPIDPVRIV